MSELKSHSDLFELIRAFEQNRNQAIEEVYRLFRNSFYKFAGQFTADRTIMHDGFQEAVIALYNNLSRKKITENRSSIQTYLFTIGKRKVLDELQSKRIARERSIDLKFSTDNNKPQNENPSKKVHNALRELGTSCRELLLKFYFDRKKIATIADEMGYKNVNTVKAQKSRCMKKLRQILTNQKQSDHVNH